MKRAQEEILLLEQEKLECVGVAEVRAEKHVEMVLEKYSKMKDDELI